MSKVLIALSWFIAGISMTVACGSVSPSFAALIASASQVSYDNSVTNLKATTVQEVIDLFVAELKANNLSPEVFQEGTPVATGSSSPSTASDPFIECVDENDESTCKQCVVEDNNKVCTDLAK
jgi:hypothetical protein